MSYAILVREPKAKNYVELCRVETNPEAIAEAAKKKMLSIRDAHGKRFAVPRYDHVKVKKL